MLFNVKSIVLPYKIFLFLQIFYTPPIDFVVMVRQAHHAWRNILNLPREPSNDGWDLVAALQHYSIKDCEYLKLKILSSSLSELCTTTLLNCWIKSERWYNNENF